MGLKLFNGDSSDEDEDISKIEINKEFARRYEHNKKREDLHRLEELEKKGFVSDSSGSGSESSDEDDEDDDDGFNSNKNISKFFKALIKVKNQDPSLLQQDTKLFESSSSDEEGDESGGEGGFSESKRMEKGQESEEEEEEEKKKKKKKKPMYLKDVVAKQLIEAGPEYREGEHESARPKSKSYVDEQEDFRKDFLIAVEEEEAAAAECSDGAGEFLKVKERRNEDGEAWEEGDGELEEKMDEYFGKDEELNGNDRFLKDYFLKKLWVDKGKSEEGLGDDFVDVSDDEEEIEQQEEYEKDYNFRFEEDGGDRVLGHARFVDGSVRKKTNARKLQRERKREREAQREFERKEELKHLKNVKKEEIIEKRNKIKEIAGIGGDAGCLFDDKDLEGDFDPDEFDKKMNNIFSEDYYNAEDADPDFVRDSDEDDGDVEKPVFEKEDELLGLPKDWDVCQTGKQFLAERERILKRKAEVEKKNGDEEGMQITRKDKELDDEDLEEIYKLDYEDTIGDLKTRFKYAKVKTNRYGLKPDELLLMDDKELNQYVSMKKLAPYRLKEWKVPERTRCEQKKKNKFNLGGKKLDVQKSGKKERSHVDDCKSATSMVGGVGDGKYQLTESNDGTRKEKRKRGHHHNLPTARLKCYGKTPSQPRKKAKH